MPHRNIVVIGGSEGCRPALARILAPLGETLPASLFIVNHVPATAEGQLARVLQQHTKLDVSTAENGQRFQPGTAYVAPGDRHLLVGADRLTLSRGPRENRARPAVDPLFRSAALFHGTRVIGIVLSGGLDDGTAGLRQIKACGGLAVIQDPATCINPQMPESAAEYVEIDETLSPDDIGAALLEWTREPRVDAGTDCTDLDTRARLEGEVGIMLREAGAISDVVQLGELVPASCPDCGGPLWEMEGPHRRFRCHTGHAFTARHLVEGLDHSEETSLWEALRVMEERVRMLRRMARQDAEQGQSRFVEHWNEKADEAEQHVQALMALLRN